MGWKIWFISILGDEVYTWLKQILLMKQWILQDVLICDIVAHRW